MDHVYDFYKPTSRNPSYPIVDGQFSISCYLKALHQCYLNFVSKYDKMVWKQKINLGSELNITFNFCLSIGKAIWF